MSTDSIPLSSSTKSNVFLLIPKIISFVLFPLVSNVERVVGEDGLEISTIFNPYNALPNAIVLLSMNSIPKEYQPGLNLPVSVGWVGSLISTINIGLFELTPVTAARFPLGLIATSPDSFPG